MRIRNWLSTVLKSIRPVLSRGKRRFHKRRRQICQALATAALAPVVVATSQADEPLFPGRLYFAGEGLQSILTTDINSDGCEDLVTTSIEGANIFLGNAAGDLIHQEVYEFQDGTVSAAVADFNGDGLPDLAVANDELDHVEVALANGDGSFSVVGSWPAGPDPDSLVAKDFNLDGIVDLALANSSADSVSVLLGVGDGSFSTLTSFAVGERPASLLTADFNGDDVPDLATANHYTDDISVLLGLGDGTFLPHQTFLSGSRPNSIVSADFDGDGDFDLAVANFNANGDPIQSTRLMGNGDGTFTAPVTVAGRARNLTTADMNDDGIVDLVGDMSIRLGIGDGTFSTPMEFEHSGYVAAGDFSGDGITDVANATSTLYSDIAIVTVLLGRGEGSVIARSKVPAGNFMISLDAADANSDGLSDLFIRTYPTITELQVRVSRGDGTFLLADSIFPVFDFAIADLNNDSIVDLVTHNTDYYQNDGDLVVMLGIGDGTFQTPVFYDFKMPLGSVATADFNGDGILDVVVSVDDGLLFSMGLGDGSFDPKPTKINSVPGFFRVFAADFDNDGFVDLGGQSSNQTFSVLLGQGDGYFSTPISRSVVTGSMHIDDLDDDGILDLIISPSFNSGLTEVGVHFGVGDGTFSDSFFIANSFRGDISTADFDGDEVTDLAITGNNSLGLMMGTGGGAFLNPVAFNPGNGGGGGDAIGDFNGDGLTDLANGNGFYPPYEVIVLFNQGDCSILLGDVNQDDKVDLLDVAPFIDRLSSGEFQAEADINGDGEVNFLDVAPFVDLLIRN